MDAVPDWLKLLGAVVSVAGGLAGLVAFFLRYSTPRNDVERYLESDPEYRQELAEELRGGRIGGLYRHTLATALDWLDRRFGSPGSQDALGICIIIALHYAYAAFFLAWGVGGPGDIAGVVLLDEGVAWPVRLPIALFFIVALPLAYLLGCWIGRQERRLKLRLRRRRGWRKHRFEVAWRGLAVFVIVVFLVLSIGSGYE